MIIVQLIGGLGNQMFQYAMARRLAILKETDLKFDISCFKHYKDRKYDLGCFNITEDFASSQEIYHLKGPEGRRIPRKIFKIINEIKPYHKRSYIKERYHYHDSGVSEVSDNVYLEGYWQSEKYFKEIGKTIRSEFKIKNKPDFANKELGSLILSEQSVSVHIRRGDYVTDPNVSEVHGICSMKYYSAAVDKILKAIKDPHFFVFSDDPIWAENNLRIDHPATFINENSGNKGYEDMRLMSLCRHNIIANSSFSWWGAWLNENPDKIVIAPKKWFNDQRINTKDQIPESWYRI